MGADARARARRPGPSSRLSSCAWSPPARWISLPGRWQDPPLELRRERSQPVLGLAFRGTSGELVAADDRDVLLWHPSPGAVPVVVRTHDRPVSALDVDATGERLASGDRGGVILVGPLGGGETTRFELPLSALRNKGRAVTALRFHPNDPRWLASGDERAGLRLWELGAHPALYNEAYGHSGEVTAVAFRPDGKQLASADANGDIVFWNGTLAGHQRLRGHRGAVPALAFTDGGRRLLSGGSDLDARLWRHEMPLVEEVARHKAEINAIWPCCEGVCSLASDGRIDVSKGGCGAAREEASGGYTSAAVPARGGEAIFAARTGEGIVRLDWPFAPDDPDRWAERACRWLAGQELLPDGRPLEEVCP